MNFIETFRLSRKVEVNSPNHQINYLINMQKYNQKINSCKISNFVIFFAELFTI